jgi:hypothetical protein
MVFTKRLRDGVRRGRIKCSVRIWTRPHVKAGGRYRMDEGQIVVDSITTIRLADITDDLARESGFSSRKDLLDTAGIATTYGAGDRVLGTVGIVGPTRMEYARAIALVDYLAHVLTRFLTNPGA